MDKFKRAEKAVKDVDALVDVAKILKIDDDIQRMTQSAVKSIVSTSNSIIFNKARKDKIRKAIKKYPYAQYSAILDSRVCPLCFALDGQIISTDDKRFKDGIFDAPQHNNCLLSGASKVLTDKGWITIRRIEKGDQVLTHKGRFKKVTNTFYQKPYRGKAFVIGLADFNQLSGRNGKPFITLTPEHPILIQEGSKKLWRQAKNIQEGDNVFVLGRKCCICDKPISYRNIACGDGFCKSNSSYLSDKQKEEIRNKVTFITMPVRYKAEKDYSHIKSRYYAREIFNLEVEEDESFIAGKGIVIHNCRCQWMYIGKEETGIFPNWRTTVSDLERFLDFAHLKSLRLRGI